MTPDDFIFEAVTRMRLEGLTAKQASDSVAADVAAVRAEMRKRPEYSLPAVEIPAPPPAEKAE